MQAQGIPDFKGLERVRRQARRPSHKAATAAEEGKDFTCFDTKARSF